MVVRPFLPPVNAPPVEAYGAALGIGMGQDKAQPRRTGKRSHAAGHELHYL